MLGSAALVGFGSGAGDETRREKRKERGMILVGPSRDALFFFLLFLISWAWVEEGMDNEEKDSVGP